MIPVSGLTSLFYRALNLLTIIGLSIYGTVKAAEYNILLRTGPTLTQCLGGEGLELVPGSVGEAFFELN